MSRYNRLIDADPIPSAPLTEEEPQIHASVPRISANPDVERDLQTNLNRIKKFCVIMVVTSPFIPVVSYFIDPYHFVFYQAIFVFLVQQYVAYAGFKCTKDDHYSRIEYYRKVVHSFYIYYLISLILNQMAAIFISSSHNYKNCEDFVNNRVCVNRTGLMTSQLVTLLFSPGIDFSVWIFYRYLLTVLNDCKAGLVSRRL